jgi:hypothetical protein
MGYYRDGVREANGDARRPPRRTDAATLSEAGESKLTGVFLARPRVVAPPFLRRPRR